MAANWPPGLLLVKGQNVMQGYLGQPKLTEAAFFEGWYSWAIRSRLDPVKKVARMMKKHLPNILSYFRHRITNAALEGINNKIQALIKKAFGYRNKDRFKNDILFHCGGLDLYPEMGL